MGHPRKATRRTRPSAASWNNVWMRGLMPLTSTFLFIEIETVFLGFGSRRFCQSSSLLTNLWYSHTYSFVTRYRTKPIPKTVTPPQVVLRIYFGELVAAGAGRQRKRGEAYATGLLHKILTDIVIVHINTTVPCQRWGAPSPQRRAAAHAPATRSSAALTCPPAPAEGLRQQRCTAATLARRLLQ